nr:tryptophan synthase subunit alpha [Methylococcus sp. BF19-07]
MTSTFQVLREAKRKALIPFITAGDPEPGFTVPALHAMVEAGADIIELGVPFSDPMADGPVIQKASERALVHHMSLRKTLDLVAEFRRTDQATPIVLMGYLNPVECMGYQRFADCARAVGVDGVLTVDMPPEEAGEFVPLLHRAGIDPIFLLAPNSSDMRVRRMAALARGYLYYVSLKGVTGASHLDLSQVESRIAHIRSLTDLPIGVGFGVKNADTAAAIGRFADAVVVGSALVEKIAAAQDRPEQARKDIIDLLATMRRAMDA